MTVWDRAGLLAMQLRHLIHGSDWRLGANMEQGKLVTYSCRQNWQSLKQNCQPKRAVWYLKCTFAAMNTWRARSVTVPAIPFRVPVFADDLTLGLVLCKKNQSINSANTILVLQKLAVQGSQSLPRAVRGCMHWMFLLQRCAFLWAHDRWIRDANPCHGAPPDELGNQPVARKN